MSWFSHRLALVSCKRLLSVWQASRQLLSCRDALCLGLWHSRKYITLQCNTAVIIIIIIIIIVNEKINVAHSLKTSRTCNKQKKKTATCSVDGNRVEVSAISTTSQTSTSLSVAWKSNFKFLYLPSERCETGGGGYTIITFVCLCVCAHSTLQSLTVCVRPTMHQPSPSSNPSPSPNPSLSPNLTPSPDHSSRLEMHGRVRREAARRRKSEWKVNLDIRNSSRSNGSWWTTT